MLLDSKEDVDKILKFQTPMGKKKNKKFKYVEEEIKSQMENEVFYENFLINLKEEHNNNKLKVKASYSSKNVLPKEKDVDFFSQKSKSKQNKVTFSHFFQQKHHSDHSNKSLKKVKTKQKNSNKKINENKDNILKLNSLSSLSSIHQPSPITVKTNSICSDQNCSKLINHINNVNPALYNNNINVSCVSDITQKNNPIKQKKRKFLFFCCIPINN